jgi:hypothetical protein
MKLIVVHPTAAMLVRPGQHIWHEDTVAVVDEVRLLTSHVAIAYRPEDRPVEVERKGKPVKTKRDHCEFHHDQLVDVMVDGDLVEMLAWKVADHLGENYTLIVNDSTRVVPRGRQLLEDEPVPADDDAMPGEGDREDQAG